MPQVVLITGTDTNVGKTVLTVLLARELLARGLGVMALKPFCSGGRDDARALQAIQPGRSLDAINPWAFAEPLTPLVAARRQGVALRLDETLAFLRRAGRDSGLLVIEGAGGLLSPLGEDFDARDLIRVLKAVPLVVAPNRLGVLNHVLLTWEALPAAARRRARLVLMQPPRPGVVARTNADLLGERLGRDRVHLFPHLPERFLATLAAARPTARVRAVVAEIADALR